MGGSTALSRRRCRLGRLLHRRLERPGRAGDQGGYEPREGVHRYLLRQARRSTIPLQRSVGWAPTRGAHADSSSASSESVPHLRYATSRPVAATVVTATSSYLISPKGF